MKSHLKMRMVDMKILTKTRKRKFKKGMSRDERFRDGVKTWVGFYRSNFHRFAKDYMGLDLFLFQQILLYMMNKVSFFMYIAARGQGKSYLIAVFCIARCILYPNTSVVVASSTKKTAQLIITKKVEEVRTSSPMVAREIKEIRMGMNDASAIFHNGSSITATVSNENSRGLRCNILIVDEFRLVKKSIVEGVDKIFNIKVMRVCQGSQ